MAAEQEPDDDLDEPDELTPRQRRLQRIEAYESSHYGQRARTVQREIKERATRKVSGAERPAAPR